MMEEGYYYNAESAQIIQTNEDDLPDGAVWEYLGSAEEMTPAEAVAKVEELYPDVSVELRFRHI